MMIDEVHLASLYREHAAAIYARCRRILRNRAAAEDASQETFMRVLRYGGQVPPTAEVRRWMYRIALNFCRNVLREARNRSRVDSDLGAFREPGCPETVIIDRDMVRRLINRTPDALRAAAWLHHVEGLDQGQVATQLRVSRRTVVTRLAAFARHASRFGERVAGSPAVATEAIAADA